MKQLGKLSLALAVAFPTYPALALDTQIVTRPDGQPVFELRFFDPTDDPFMDDEGPQSSTWVLSQHQRDKVREAIRYWAEIIQPAPGLAPAIINVGTRDDEGNAAGGSELEVVDGVLRPKLQAALQGNPVSTLDFGAHAMFYMGDMKYDDLAIVPSHLPRPDNGAVDLTAVAFHELAHGLGVSSGIEDFPDTEDRPQFGKVLSSFDQHIRDINGNPARPGQSIICPAACANPPDPDGFQMPGNLAYFVGNHVSDVLAGALPGIPLKVLFNDGPPDDPTGVIDNYMSHSELKNSLMSHQPYRNYTNFMEAELAMLQDLGYTIDRRNFFGFSVYGNDQDIVNTNGFFGRNAQGTDYVAGSSNTSTLGLGLHVYGDNNTVRQRADLLTTGAGGAGIRVDGTGNTIIVEPSTRVYANGVNGRGLIFAYGKDHSLVQRGDVQANGPQGIAITFDFGNNILGNDGDYRGSFIVNNDRDPADVGLDGALVDTFDLTGRLSGSQAAIHLSRNALVNTINVMAGAQIQGDITSDYAERDDNGQLRLTQLRFGLAADANGRATTQADAGFALAYQGNIQGNNLAVTAQGGTTQLEGTHRVHDVTVAPAARLQGQSQYTLVDNGTFINQGTVVSGLVTGQIDVVGNYQQTATGQLQLIVDGQHGSPAFTVSGQARLDGQLTLVPQRDWYASNWQQRTDSLVQAGTTTGGFSSVNGLLASPTLNVLATPLAGGSYDVRIARAGDAYARLGNDTTTRQTGAALDQLVKVAGEDAHGLYTTLDFSAPDGTTVQSALRQLSPAAYAAMAASSLSRERQITGIVGEGQRAVPVGDWRGFAVPFGSRSWQPEREGRIAYDADSRGLVLGLEKRQGTRDAWTIGLHGAVSEQTVKPRAMADTTGKTSSLALGVHTRYAEAPNAGLYAYGLGRLAVERATLKRQLLVDDYSARNRADWSALSGTVQAGVGYQWPLTSVLSAGPVAALSYTTLRQPGVTESGSDVSRLSLDSNTVHSLRSSLGLGLRADSPLASGGAVTLTAQTTWDREWLDRDVTRDARFAGYRDIRFHSADIIASRDTLGLSAGLAYRTVGGFSLGAALGAHWLGAGQKSVSGNLNASWRF